MLTLTTILYQTSCQQVSQESIQKLKADAALFEAEAVEMEGEEKAGEDGIAGDG